MFVDCSEDIDTGRLLLCILDICCRPFLAGRIVVVVVVEEVICDS